MVVTATWAPLARAIAASLSPAGVGMFVVGLCPADGPATAERTNFISTGMIDAQFAPLVTNPESLYAAARSVGVECTLSDCEALVATSDVSQEKPHPSVDGQGALARLGLQIAQIEE